MVYLTYLFRTMKHVSLGMEDSEFDRFKPLLLMCGLGNFSKLYFFHLKNARQ